MVPEFEVSPLTLAEQDAQAVLKAEAAAGVIALTDRKTALKQAVDAIAGFHPFRRGRLRRKMDRLDLALERAGDDLYGIEESAGLRLRASDGMVVVQGRRSNGDWMRLVGRLVSSASQVTTGLYSGEIWTAGGRPQPLSPRQASAEAERVVPVLQKRGRAASAVQSPVRG